MRDFFAANGLLHEGHEHPLEERGRTAHHIHVEFVRRAVLRNPIYYGHFEYHAVSGA